MLKKVFLLIALYFLLPQIYFFFFSNLDDPIDTKSTRIQKNPYEDLQTYSLLKLAIHLHSNQNFFSFEKHSVEEISEQYSKKGYDSIVFTDYEKISYPTNQFASKIPGYEWGHNFRKRHLLCIGSETVVSDPYYIFPTTQNLQRAISLMHNDGCFVTINHPNLFSGIPFEELQKLHSYHALELISPYGDVISLYDSILSKGIKTHLSAVDDLHYFSEETIRTFDQNILKTIFQHMTFSRGKEAQAFRRYILIGSRNNTKEIVENLKKGNYLSVLKHSADLPDPEPPRIQFRNKVLKLQTKEKLLLVKVLGKQGKILKEWTDVTSVEFPYPVAEEYIRLEIYSTFGVLYSNAIYKEFL